MKTINDFWDVKVSRNDNIVAYSFVLCKYENISNISKWDYSTHKKPDIVSFPNKIFNDFMFT